MKQVFIILIAVFSSLYACAQQLNVEYQYDNLNRLTTVVYPDGTLVNYTYDANGNRLSKTVIAASQLPSVETAAISQVGSSLTVCGGNVISDGGTALTARGVCWSTTHNPTTSDSHSVDGSSTGSFVSSLTNLTPNITYYVRAYATNSVGTAYGQEVNFTTDCNQLAVEIIASSSSVNLGESVTLTASGASNYSWNTGQSGSSITVTPASTTTYTVTGTNAYGCSGTASKTVSVNTTTTLNLAHSICEGNSYNFYGESLSVSGTYTHLLQGDRDTIVRLELTVFEAPVVTISGNTSICEGESTTLTVEGADTYLWTTDGTTEEQITVSTAGTYNVFGFNETTGCYAIAHVRVNVWQPAVTSFIVQTQDCYEWNGESYCQSGVFTQYLQTAFGCDSIVTLYLIIEDNDDVVEDDDSVEDDDTEGESTNDNDNDSNNDDDDENPNDEDNGENTDDDNTVEGVNENTDIVGDLTLYPNPTTGIVNIRLTPETCNLTSEIQVFDMYGKLIETTHALSPQPSPQSSTQINLSRYSTGIYIIKMVNDGKVIATGKVVKR